MLVYIQESRMSHFSTVYGQFILRKLYVCSGKQAKRVSWILWSANCWNRTICFPQELICLTLSSPRPSYAVLRSTWVCVWDWERERAFVCSESVIRRREARGAERSWIDLFAVESEGWTQSRLRFLLSVWPLLPLPHCVYSARGKLFDHVVTARFCMFTPEGSLINTSFH